MFSPVTFVRAVKCMTRQDGQKILSGYAVGSVRNNLGARESDVLIVAGRRELHFPNHKFAMTQEQSWITPRLSLEWKKNPKGDEQQRQGTNTGGAESLTVRLLHQGFD